ncbi:hypothetical protein ColTof4_01378 [Colletotrichum tofieldiae]|nr:hypothetical protein ColTof4_01378 [Colletotrichum tofieldiae]
MADPRRLASLDGRPTSTIIALSTVIMESDVFLDKVNEEAATTAIADKTNDTLQMSESHTNSRAPPDANQTASTATTDSSEHGSPTACILTTRTLRWNIERGMPMVVEEKVQTFFFVKTA